MQAKAGDVYCVYNEKLKKYTACQITKVEDKDGKQMAVKLSLNWSGEEPLKEEELSDLRPLYVDYMYWDNSLDMNNVGVDVPAEYIFVGNVAPIMDERSDSYSDGWGSGDIIYRQLRWQDILKEKRDAFKAADKSEEKVILEGEECRISRRRLKMKSRGYPFP